MSALVYFVLYIFSYLVSIALDLANMNAQYKERNGGDNLKSLSKILIFSPRKYYWAQSQPVTLRAAAAAVTEEDDYVEEKRKINFSILISVIMPLDIAV